MVTTSARWRDAAAGTALFASLLMLGWSLRPLVDHLTWALHTGSYAGRIGVAVEARAVAWLVIVVAVLMGRRLLAAGLAVLAVAGDVAVALSRLDGPLLGSPGPVAWLWPALLGTAAATLLLAGVRAESGGAVVGRRGVVIAVAATLAAAMSAAGPALGAEVFGPPPADSVDPGFFAGAMIDSRVLFWSGLASYGSVAVLAAVWLATAPAPVRLRLVALTAPIAVFVVVANLGFDYAFASAVYGQALVSVRLQLTLALVGTLLAFVLAALAVRAGTPDTHPKLEAVSATVRHA
jgi:hypothetical protein